MVMEMVLRIYMHCQECIRKVKRYLKGVQGLYDVMMDSVSFKVLLRGKGEELLEVLERTRWKSHEEVELLYQSSTE
ncbi:heavy metal-associated isoprenylated plant protein 3 [Cinnamomum micranthum f. kanehirae]|uniref:Heavy metal-associated isoprenylated plant protein 3 n=1 Tax=Cinnamomum micranthum f. kanehirae TaxID=337451 RepID=A0A3S3ML55_9MAGN|nr:heavy metal-associated isoprenylated plant protein 3 [Cinnamomum micranthum f. kanehirae]